MKLQEKKLKIENLDRQHPLDRSTSLGTGATTVLATKSRLEEMNPVHNQFEWLWHSQ